MSSPRNSYQPSSGAMLAKPCSCRKRSISSSGLTPASTLRKTFRTERSSKTIDELDCSAPIGRTLPPRLADWTVRKQTLPESPVTSTPSESRLPSIAVAVGSASASYSVHSLASPMTPSLQPSDTGRAPSSTWYSSCVPAGKRASSSATASTGGSPVCSGTASSTVKCEIWLALAPNHRWRTSQSARTPSSSCGRSPIVALLAVLEHEPEEAARRQREQVRQLADRREARPPEH